MKFFTLSGARTSEYAIILASDGLWDVFQDREAVEFAAARYAIIEAAGTVTLQVRRRGPLDGTASVAYATKDGTAVAVEDYVAKSGTLTFGPGEDTAEIVIEIIDDDTHEADDDGDADLADVIEDSSR